MTAHNQTARSLSRLAAAAIVVATGLTVAACSSGGAMTPLHPGLSARMDQPNAVLDRTQAVAIVNAYRTTQGVGPLSNDIGLDGTAQALVNQYASTGTPPKTPSGLVGMKLSAGYSTFAETFSGWRNNPADAAGLTPANATKAGIATAYNGTSGYGVYWVLVLDQ
ncbi:CAP domain-containing protein [Devosia rhodophyticola]|uniref:CAP domain-containing protein n=1 Tax=Devosia rhodophyticola TaxID=3026423 RepID=A0ABY7YU81_9HYPH|nr:CAP domain-containing protein [Devosia rhodophyticola]WDR04663.1 CAP domain-containing protein [Devosia rhodophyticola]